MQYGMDKLYNKIFYSLNERLTCKNEFLSKCIQLNDMVGKLTKIRNDLNIISKYTLGNSYLSQEESDADIFEDDNKNLQNADNNSVLSENDGRTQADIEEISDESTNKENKITETVVSEITDKLEKHVTVQIESVDKKDEIPQVGDSVVINKIGDKKDETIQAGDGKVVDEDAGKNDKKQQVDDSKYMEEKVYNTTTKIRNIFFTEGL
uniref:ING domain-containing protein n=1 Tax=Strongyloides papillosus TaxID=174720 RepID=A0A0N5BHS3_STREA